MVYILLPPALRATPLINAGGKAFPTPINNNLPFYWSLCHICHGGSKGIAGGRTG